MHTETEKFIEALHTDCQKNPNDPRAGLTKDQLRLIIDALEVTPPHAGDKGAPDPGKAARVMTRKLHSEGAEMGIKFKHGELFYANDGDHIKFGIEPQFSPANLDVNKIIASIKQRKKEEDMEWNELSIDTRFHRAVHALTRDDNMPALQLNGVSFLSIDERKEQDTNAVRQAVAPLFKHSDDFKIVEGTNDLRPHEIRLTITLADNKTLEEVLDMEKVREAAMKEKPFHSSKHMARHHGRISELLLNDHLRSKYPNDPKMWDR